MGKYDVLGAFLRRWAARNNGRELELSFMQIEGIIRAMLPKAALDSAWWSNHRSGDRSVIQSRSWLDAGFEARLVTDQERVMFHRRDQRPVVRHPASPALKIAGS